MPYTKTPKSTATYSRAEKPYELVDFLFQDGVEYLFQDGNNFAFEKTLQISYTKIAKSTV